MIRHPEARLAMFGNCSVCGDSPSILLVDGTVRGIKKSRSHIGAGVAEEADENEQQGHTLQFEYLLGQVNDYVLESALAPKKTVSSNGCDDVVTMSLADVTPGSDPLLREHNIL